MYRITAENEGTVSVLHVPERDSRQRLASGKFIEEVSQIPSFTFTITPFNSCYEDTLHDRKTTIELVNTRTGVAEFEGVVLTSETCMTSAGKFYKKVICEGYMGYLCNTIQPYHHYEDHTPAMFLLRLLEVHNAQVPEHMQITLGSVNVSGNTNSKTTAYRNTLEEIKSNLTERLGGELRVRKENGRLYLDYLETITEGTTSGAVIELGHNMKSLTAGTDATNIITRLIPLGCQLNDETAERLTIAEVNDGCIWIDDENAIEQYGVIVGTVEFDDITLPQNLLDRGRSYQQENNRVKGYYEATVLDLSTINSEVTGLRAGNSYRFVNRFMKLDEYLRIIKRTVDIFKPYVPTIEIGDKTKKITDIATRTNHLIQYELPQMESDILVTSKAISTALITAATTGYVVIRPDEILIMDTDDVETAKSVWRFNSGGLGYSSTGYNGTYGLAMTMNGQIVADFIAAGYMYADRIRGGTLTVGAVEVDGVRRDGVISVLDDSGTEICRLDKDGAKIFGEVYTRNSDGYWLQLKDGQLKGGIGGTQYGYFDAAAELNFEGTMHHGLHISSSDCLLINCPGGFAVNNQIGQSRSLTYVTGGTVTPQVEWESITAVTGVTRIVTDENGNVTDADYNTITFPRLKNITINSNFSTTTDTFTNGILTSR